MKNGEFDDGYFSKILKTIGENPTNNLKIFKFKEDVLNQYKDLSFRNPMEFRLKEKEGIIYINHIGKWDLKCGTSNNLIRAHLIDLANLPNNQQERWQDYLVNKEK